MLSKSLELTDFLLTYLTLEKSYEFLKIKIFPNYKIKDNNNYNIVGIFAIRATAQFHSQSELTFWAVSNPAHNLS